MSTYQELKGLKVKYLSADTSGDRTQEGELFYNSTDFKLKSFVATAAWSSSGSVITARFNSGIGGTQTAAFLAGGATPDDSVTDDTYEYNGTGWTIGGDMAGTDRLTTGSGTLTAGLIAGGNPGSSPYNNADSEEYNGTAWTEGNNLNTARRYSGHFGIQTAAVICSGETGVTAATEEYNGTSWSNGNDVNTAKGHIGGAGILTAGLKCGGAPTSAATEEYDGTNWTSVNSMNTARRADSLFGLQTAAIVAGGYTTTQVANTEEYNGTSWTEIADISAASYYGSGVGSTTAGMYVQGLPGNSRTEEWNVSLTTFTGASWASGGNVNNTRRNAGCMGPQTAALYAGGFSPPYVNYSEEYNGSTWTEGNNLTIARECSTSGFGTQTAGAVAGGGAPDNISSPYSGYSNSTDEYDGTSWSEGGDINSHRLGMATCGTQTAGFGAGGYQGANHPESPPSNTAKCEQYNGTSWTEVADLNTAKSSCGHFGTQTASIAVRGAGNNTESWNGSSWTNLPASVVVFNGGNHGGGSQTAGVVYGPRTYNATELWDGTTWATSAKYSTSRGGNNAGDSTSGLLVGGYTGSANSNATEEFTGATTGTATVKSIDFD